MDDVLFLHAERARVDEVRERIKTEYLVRRAQIESAREFEGSTLAPVSTGNGAASSSDASHADPSDLIYDVLTTVTTRDLDNLEHVLRGAKEDAPLLEAGLMLVQHARTLERQNKSLLEKVRLTEDVHQNWRRQVRREQQLRTAAASPLSPRSAAAGSQNGDASPASHWVSRSSASSQQQSPSTASENGLQHVQDAEQRCQQEAGGEDVSWKELSDVIELARSLKQRSDEAEKAHKRDMKALRKDMHQVMKEIEQAREELQEHSQDGWMMNGIPQPL